ncbi:hypothetical protein ACIPYS_31215 [Kitasatospora sp. NPDC089913]|uniref:hypothetical protein n=1 Tax=Streptomycetaceae TaxID=2062 RepID=UPI00087B2F3E|nr:hypothetical protein [Streptomyces sp. TLI_053]SDT69952.1 hypothetical protein SAMN05216371_3877 [Streptomyces sp. TLI_053]
MGDGRDERRAGPLPSGLRMPCPSCAEGVRTEARMGLRGGRTGTGHIPQTCRHCGGLGFLGLALRE